MTRSAWLGTAVVVLVTTSCGLSGPFSAGSSTSREGRATPTHCESAPPQLVERLSGGLLVRGAYVSNVYVAAAATLSGTSVTLDNPWWAVGRINGAGVQPELAIWLWGRNGSTEIGEVRSANPAADRYTDFATIDPTLVSGDFTIAELIDCVGSIPEP